MTAPWRRRFVRVALALSAPTLLDGCVSVGISRSKPRTPGLPTGTVEVAIYESSGDYRKSATTPRKVVSELVRSDVKPERTVYRGAEPTWTISGLEPGRYRLTALAVIDQGREKSLPNQDSERFRLRAGERVRAVIVLKKAPVGAIFGVSAGVAAAIITLIALSIVAALPLDEEPILEGSRSRAPERSLPLPTLPSGARIPHQ